MPNVHQEENFWFIDNCLVVPNSKNIQETLFRLAHNQLGHFGLPKTYGSLRESYYWPNMGRNLEEGYIPGCPDCQQNKARTMKPIGLLHPLPVPDGRCDSVAMDFIGPLPKDDGYDMILTFTDCLGSDIRLVPTVSTLTAEQLAEIFFHHLYCKNGLPLEIVSDCNKLFLAHFWKRLHALTGVKLKMSSSYHPKTDGSSERTNKTVIQCIHYVVEQDQKGWACTLPKIRFDIMNTVNASMNLTPFQLCYRKSPRLLPPITEQTEPMDAIEKTAHEITARMCTLEMEAQDSLLTAKVSQARSANTHRELSFPFKVGDHVVLSTRHRRHEY
jgi:hypothetical protein